VTQTKALTGTKAPTETKAVSATKAVSTTKEPNEEAGKTFVHVGDNAKFGKFLVDAKGMTLYIFDKDTQAKSNCAGGCAKAWPPLTVKDEDEKLTLGAGVTSKLEVIARGDGTYQVTANGMPLYYYAKDKAVGDVTGQAAGGVWWVVAPDGSKIAKK
jgi:predicted lipoprotein with Yx(FWY)xxD motif